MRRLRVVATASWLCALLSCRSQEDPGDPIPRNKVEEERLLACLYASKFVKDAFQLARDKHDPTVWRRLGSNFDGELAKDVARVTERLNEATRLNAPADQLDVEVARIAERVTKLPRAACQRIRGGHPDGGS